MANDPQDISPQLERWFKLVSQVDRIEQTLQFMASKDVELERRVDADFRELRMQLETLRRQDMPDLVDVIDTKMDKTAFAEFKAEHFMPIKTTVEAINHFKSKMLAIGVLLSLVIPAIVTLILRKFFGGP